MIIKFIDHFGERLAEIEAKGVESINRGMQIASLFMRKEGVEDCTHCIKFYDEFGLIDSMERKYGR